MVSVLMIKPQTPELIDILTKYCLPVKSCIEISSNLESVLSLEEEFLDDEETFDKSGDMESSEVLNTVSYRFYFNFYFVLLNFFV